LKENLSIICFRRTC